MYMYKCTCTYVGRLVVMSCDSFVFFSVTSFWLVCYTHEITYMYVYVYIMYMYMHVQMYMHIVYMCMYNVHCIRMRMSTCVKIS